MEEEAARGGSGVDDVGETAEADILFMEVPDQIHKVLDAAAEPIQFPDDQRVRRGLQERSQETLWKTPSKHRSGTGYWPDTV